MKKVSIASLIIAIVLMLCSIAVTFIGFVYMNGARVVKHVSTYGNMRTSYYTTQSLGNYSIGMIIVGGFLFLGGVLFLILAANTFVPAEPKKCCHKEEKAKEVKQAKTVEEAPKAEECTCRKECEEPAEPEEEAPAEEPSEEETPEPEAEAQGEPV